MGEIVTLLGSHTMPSQRSKLAPTSLGPGGQTKVQTRSVHNDAALSVGKKPQTDWSWYVTAEILRCIWGNPSVFARFLELSGRPTPFFFQGVC